MPAAAWAAKSGDPVLFATRDSLPAGHARRAARPTSSPKIYVLGPAGVDRPEGRDRAAASSAR